MALSLSILLEFRQASFFHRVIAPRGELIGHVAGVTVIANHYESMCYGDAMVLSGGELFTITPRYLTEW